MRVMSGERDIHIVNREFRIMQLVKSQVWTRGGGVNKHQKKRRWSDVVPLRPPPQLSLGPGRHIHSNCHHTITTNTDYGFLKEGYTLLRRRAAVEERT